MTMHASPSVRRGVVALLVAVLVLTMLPAAALTRPNRVHAGDAQNSRRAADVGPRNLGVEWVTNGSEVDGYTVGGIEAGSFGDDYGLLVHEGLVIATGTKDTDSGDQATFAFDAATGDVEWITAGVGGGCKPAIDDDGTLWSFDRVGATARALVAINPATGELDPTRRLESLPSGPNVSTCSYAIHIADNGLVVFYNGGGPDPELVGVDPDTAEVVWEIDAERFPTVLMTDPTTGDLITTATVAGQVTILRIDPDDGVLLDSFTLPGSEVGGQMVTDDGQLIVSTTGQFGAAPTRTMRVDLATGAVVWQREDLGRLGSHALGGADGDSLVAWISAGPARLVSLSLADGTTDWLLPMPGQRANSSILSDAAGTIYVSLFAPNQDLTISSVSADGTFLGGVSAEEVGTSDWVGAIDDEGRLFATGRRGGLTNWLALTDVGEEIVPVVPGEPGVGRIEGDDPIGSICEVQIPEDGGARSVVLARRDIFADALAGAPLAGDDSCILFTTGGADADRVDPVTAAEIDRVLPPGGLIRILGGTSAISVAVEAQLRTAGYTVERFAGDSRYDTALAIARQVRIENPGNTDIMLAFAGNWPDAVTGGAYAAFTGTPIVLTDLGQLHPTAATAAAELGVTRTFVLGGTAVIGDTAASAMPGAQRVAGDTRMATAVAVAEQLWPPLVGTPTAFTVVNLERDDSYSLALAAAPLSAALGGPQLGVGQGRYPAETQGYLESLGLTQLPAAVLVGDVTVIDDGTATAIEGSIQP